MEDFDSALNRAIDGIDKTAIDLSKKRSLMHVLQRVLIGTNAGSYLRNLFEPSEKSYSDKATEEVDFESNDARLLHQIPLSTELYVGDEWTESVDIEDKSKDSMSGPGYKVGFQKNEVYFSIVFNSIDATEDGYVAKYTYEVSKRVENDWY